jgi:hypothetical protein
MTTTTTTKEREAHKDTMSAERKECKLRRIIPDGLEGTQELQNRGTSTNASLCQKSRKTIKT